ncbi:MAG: sulfite exporter TauE/SafE family protein [Polyangiaceae bacterium]
MSDGPQALAILAAAGVGAGFINTMAGGGSLLTLPALMLLGLPADVANGTNRLSIVTQSLSGVWAFHRQGRLPKEALPQVLGPTVTGAAVGALVATQVPPTVLKPVLLGTMIAIAMVMAVAPKMVAPEPDVEPRPLGLKSGLGLFVAGVYGGFVQAGVGFVLLAVLGGMLRYDLLRANALKLAGTLIFGVVALAIFIVARQVAWAPAVVLAVATVIGSQLGVRFAVKVAPKWLRRIVLVCVIASCVAALLR